MGGGGGEGGRAGERAEESRQAIIKTEEAVG